MEELALIIEERRRSILEMGSREERQKFQAIEEERKRVERENWILRVLKSVKVLSAEQKRIIHRTTLRMMGYYHAVPVGSAPAETPNFLELMINLFVDFFNRFDSIDFTHLKAVIRPNNNYIVVDLLKALVELGRKDFKNALQARFKEQLASRSEKKLSVRSLVKLPPISANIDHEQPQQGQGQGGKEGTGVPRIPLQAKLRTALLQKYGRAVQTCNFQHLQQRANELYFDLLYTNQRNSARIQKYLEGCFGAKRHINYDASGLYTQEEMRRLEAEQRERAAARLSEVGELRGEVSGEQLKEYFKMQVELHEASVGLRGLTRTGRLQAWFPLCLLKNGDKLHPYQLAVELNGAHLSLEEFEQRTGKRLKAYMRELLAEARGEAGGPAAQHDPEYSRFPKKDFISYQQAKVLELINQEVPLATLNPKKEPLLPDLSKEQEESSRRKVKSEAKISNKSYLMPPVRPFQLEKKLEKRMNYSSILKPGQGSRRKIDSIIEQIVRSGDCK